jgi:hypothetical protein
MNRLEQRVERDLRQIADRATPSPDAWTSILARIADQEPATETEIIMLTEPAPTATRRRWLPFAVAAAVVALVIVGIALLTRDDSPSGPVSPPTTAEATVVPSEAMSAAQAYIERYNAGDAAGVLALFAPGARFLDHWGVDDGAEWTPGDFQSLIEWKIAQGSQLVDAVCGSSPVGRDVPLPTVPGTTSTELTGEETIVCEYGEHDAPTQAAGRDPVAITLTFVVGSDGIHEWNRVMGVPDFLSCCADFSNWMSRFHPEDVERSDFGGTVEEARVAGALYASLAEEWAAYTTPGSYASSPRVCKWPCSATEPNGSPTTSQPG